MTSFVTNPNNVVYFTGENIISYENSLYNNHTSLQLISLPSEYNTEDGVRTLIENVLRIGKVDSVNIIERKNYNHRLRTEVITKTAFIDFICWNSTPSVEDLYRQLNLESNLQGRTNSVTAITSTPIHWDNGDTMTHLSIREARVGSGKIKTYSTDEEPVLAQEGLVLAEDDWNSLYIPVLPNNMYIQHPDNTTNTFQPRHLKMFIENDLKLGKIQRVDFIDRELEDSSVVKSVFIHFESWNNNTNTRFLREKLNTLGQFRQKGYYDGGMHRILVRNDNGDKVPGYFVFKINHKPIPDVVETELNMSQLVAANKVLEEKMIEKNELIAKLTAELDELRQKVTDTAAVVA